MYVSVHMSFDLRRLLFKFRRIITRLHMYVRSIVDVVVWTVKKHCDMTF